MTMDIQPNDPALPRRRGLIVSVILNGVLFLLVCGLVLYAFMLKVDLDEGKRRLSKEVEAHQQAERYLVETRNLLTNSLRENEQLKAQLAWKESDYQAAVSAKPALPVVVDFRSSLLGQGLVAVINNTSDRYLTLVLVAPDPPSPSMPAAASAAHARLYHRPLR
jgi:flagellar basal body-associated protein FliL